MKIVDFNEDSIEYKKINMNETVFLIGAGVSMDTPTCLPSGKELTNYYLDLSIGRKPADNLREIWSEINDIIHDNSKFEFPLMRLEFIIGQINKVDKEFNRVSLINGINQFSKAKANNNHKLIAKIVEKGGTVITPNFDNCIEKEIGGNFTVNDHIGVPVMTKDSFDIYYFHGIAEDLNNLKDSLGATIDKIKEGLPKQFKHLLINWFEKGYSIIMLGYSASDFFDVIPFFESFPNNYFKGTAIFFQHGTSMSDHDLYRIKKCLSPFQTQIIMKGNTLELLEQLVAEKIARDNEEIERDWWKLKFDEIINTYSNEELTIVRTTNAIRLSDQVDISLEKIIENKEKRINTCIEMLLKRKDLFVFFSQLPDKETSIIPAIQRLHSSKYLKFLEHNYPEYLQNYNKLNKIIKQIYKNWNSPRECAKKQPFNSLCKKIENEPCAVQTYNSKTIYSVLIQVNLLYHDWKDNQLDKNNAFRLLNCLNKMLELPYNLHLYISYCIELLIAQDTLTAILTPEKNNLNIENQMLEISLEICSLLYVTKVYLHYFRKNTIIYRITGNESNKIIAEKNYIIATKISQITGKSIRSKEEILKKGI
ncbi:MAG: hypothetical protein SOR93_02515 [Clostridiales Family XIII bacterium]|nr:hypothetical protein [Clostridia bacterium]MDY3010123.1 hypothetical protein [Clostridiales Family XIII bacterium]